MFRYKSNKKTVILAAMIIMLCLICLVGATLALFTGQTDDGAIGVITTAGNIKVDIVDTTAEQNSLVGEYLQFQTSSTNKEIYFEPGATYYTQGFKVENEGDINIKFRLSVSETIKTDEDVKVDIEEFYESFDMWITTNSADAGNACDVRQFVGELAAKTVGDETYFLHIRMKESAGNDFQKKTYTGIGVTVYAVQSNVDITNIEE